MVTSTGIPNLIGNILDMQSSLNIAAEGSKYGNQRKSNEDTMNGYQVPRSVLNVFVLIVLLIDHSATSHTTSQTINSDTEDSQDSQDCNHGREMNYAVPSYNHVGDLGQPTRVSGDVFSGSAILQEQDHSDTKSVVTTEGNLRQKSAIPSSK